MHHPNNFYSLTDPSLIKLFEGLKNWITDLSEKVIYERNLDKLKEEFFKLLSEIQNRQNGPVKEFISLEKYFISIIIEYIQKLRQYNSCYISSLKDIFASEAILSQHTLLSSKNKEDEDLTLQSIGFYYSLRELIEEFQRKQIDCFREKKIALLSKVKIKKIEALHAKAITYCLNLKNPSEIIAEIETIKEEFLEHYQIIKEKFRFFPEKVEEATRDLKKVIDSCNESITIIEEEMKKVLNIYLSAEDKKFIMCFPAFSHPLVNQIIFIKNYLSKKTPKIESLIASFEKKWAEMVINILEEQNKWIEKKSSLADFSKKDISEIGAYHELLQQIENYLKYLEEKFNKIDEIYYQTTEEEFNKKCNELYFNKYLEKIPYLSLRNCLLLTKKKVDSQKKMIFQKRQKRIEEICEENIKYLTTLYNLNSWNDIKIYDIVQYKNKVENTQQYLETYQKSDFLTYEEKNIFKETLSFYESGYLKILSSIEESYEKKINEVSAYIYNKNPQEFQKIKEKITSILTIFNPSETDKKQDKIFFSSYGNRNQESVSRIRGEKIDEIFNKLTDSCKKREQDFEYEIHWIKNFLSQYTDKWQGKKIFSAFFKPEWMKKSGLIEKIFSGDRNSIQNIYEQIKSPENKELIINTILDKLLLDGRGIDFIKEHAEQAGHRTAKICRQLAPNRGSKG